MKKLIFLIALFFVSLSSIEAQNPDFHFNGVVIGTFASDPTGVEQGQIYWNSTDVKFRVYNGTVWSDLIGAGSGDMILASVQTNTGAKTFESGTLLLRNVGDTFNGSFTNTNTADRVYTLQDADGTLAFTTDIIDYSADDTVYGISWDANTDAATKNAIYDKIESLVGGGATQLSELSDVTSATQTSGFAIISDGGNYSGRLLTEADISDLGTYLITEVDGSTTNELNTSVTMTAGSLGVVDAGGTQSTSLISTDGGNTITAGADGKLYSAAGAGESTTVSDTATVDLTLTGSDITADVIENALTLTESQISDLTHNGHTIQDETTPLTQRSNLDFQGGGVTVTDNAGGDKTIVTITGTEIAVTSLSGWADYTDTTYTTGSPFTLTTAAGSVELPNNAGTIRDTEKPSDMTSFYDGTTITGVNGDAYSIDIEFKVRPTSPSADVRLNVLIDIGGVVGEIYPRDFSLTKGNGIEHYYLSSFLYYTLDTWETNGGTVKVQAFNSDVEIYDIRYVFVREHKSGNEFITSNAMTSDHYEAIINSTGATALNPFATISDLPTDDQTAVEVPITDAGGLITATEVENALQENRTAINLNTAKVTNTDAQGLTWVDGTNTMEISGGTNAIITGFLETADISGLVPYTGANNDVNIGLNEMYASSLRADGQSGSTGGSLNLRMESGFSSPSGYFNLASPSANRLQFNYGNKNFQFDISSIGDFQNRVITIPDKAGTMALTNDLTGFATQLSDLTDVNTSTPTNRNVLVADGVDFESRALVEADISDLGTYGDVFKTGTPLVNQVATWIDGSTIKGTDGFTFQDLTTYHTVDIGVDDTEDGWLRIYGNNGSTGGILDIYNGSSSDTEVDLWRLYANTNGDLRLGVAGGASLQIDATTLALFAPSTTNANITTLGAKALITKEYGDANYVGGSGTVTSVAVSGTDGIEVDSGSPITTSGTIQLGLSASTLTSLGLADTALQSEIDGSTTNELNTSVTMTAGSLGVVDAGGTQSTSLISADGGNTITAGADGKLYSAAGAGESTTVSDTAEIDLTLTGSDITADIITGSIDVLKLDSGVQTSLGLADTALQSEVDGSITNEIQNLSNANTGVDHTLSISSGVGTLKLAEGTNINLVTSGTAQDAVVTINSTASGADGLGSDGDKGDITVGGTGTTLTIDADAVTYAKMQNSSVGFTVLGKTATGSGDFAEIVAGTDGVLRRSGTGNLGFGSLVTNNYGNNTVSLGKMSTVATQTFLGRNTAATGNVEALSTATAKTMLNLSGTNSGDNAVNTLYSGLVSNATHTGEVTGATALTIASGVVDSDNITNGTIDELDLDVSVNASLDLADTSLQSEVDGSITNELQTIANTSDATTHTATLSDSGGSLQLIEGSGITLTTGGTGLNGTVTIASSGGGGDVSKVGTPVDDQVGVWTGDGTLEGTSNFQYSNSTGVLILQKVGAAMAIESTGVEVLRYDTDLSFYDDAVTVSIAGDMTANSFIKSGGTASQFLKANGSVDSSTYLTSVGIANLTATGTPSATTYLRGDNTWATIAAGGGTIGGSITDNQVAVGATTANNIEGSSSLTFIDQGVYSELSTSDDALRLKAAAGSTYLEVDEGNGYVNIVGDINNPSGTITTGFVDAEVFTDTNGTASLTGTVLNLSDNITGKIYNEATPSTSTTFTTTGLKTGGFAVTYINVASEPTVNGSAVESGGSVFEVSTVMKLVAYSPDGTTVEHFFISLGTPSGGASPLTTKGDIYSYSTVDARLGVGSNGQILTADSTEPTGLKWATASGGGNLSTSGTITTGAIPVFDTATSVIGTTGLLLTDTGTTTQITTDDNRLTFWAGGYGAGSTYLRIDESAGTFRMSGDVTVDNIIRNAGVSTEFLKADGSVDSNTYLTKATNEKTKAITIESPTSSEDISLFFTNKAITITEIRAVVRGSSPSVTWTVRHGTDRSGAGAQVVTGGTATTSQTTGSDVVSFNDATIVTDSFVWLETTAQSGTVDELNITIIYTED